MSGVFISVRKLVIVPTVITQERSKRPTPEMELFPDYNPL